MPKLKSKRSLRRRFRLTASGKTKRAKANRRHLLGLRATKRKRQLRKPATTSTSQSKKIRRLLPK